MRPPSLTSDSDVVERLALLSSSVPDEDSKAVVSELRGLVGALVDQLAAGQVETLYSLQTAAAAVRHGSAAFQAGTVAPIEQLHEVLRALTAAEASLTASAALVASDLAERLTSEIGGQFSTLVDVRLKAAEATITDAVAGLHATAATLQVGLADGAAQVQAALTDSAAQVQAALTDSATLAFSRFEQAADQLRTTNAGVVETATATAERATATLAASAHAFNEGLDRSGTVTVDKVTSVTDLLVSTARRIDEGINRTAAEAMGTFGEVLENLVAVSAETLDGVDHAGRNLVLALNGRLKSFFEELEVAIEVQSQRDIRLDAELDGRVRKLVDRTDASIARSSDRLRKETDRLAMRDQEQEYLRADAFVSALESLLSRSGGRSHLRDKVRGVMVSERRKRADVVVELEAKTAEHAHPPATADVLQPVLQPERSPRKVAAKKAPTVAPAKAAPRRKRTAPKQEDTP